ncbi:YafY family protein [Fusibacter sp. 3D3]|uniref:helix-turn-helix transcriptional regulator n=1 Tax=Fusibacter sp. 3D3 TaxID=1048380 RepID=UPI000853CE31|nr:WYL domain-containing protein [Fusibacter sp. 3D3]GAU79652.1 transcriptional regulator, DeoR family [Fusibacter sp. 3D3]
MKKSERLNDMMIYLNGKNTFNLKDLIYKYHISKSTALRDIQSLEEIGMPIYSQSGRNGFYGILPNRLLSPIVFNVDEMYALYFAMLTLVDYQTTPFHLCTQTLKNKFELCLSNEKVHQLRKMEDILSMGVIKHFNESKCLKDILTFAIENKVCEVTYMKDSLSQILFVQFFDISSSFGQWYSTAYNFQSQKPIVLRCDKVVAVKESSQYVAKNHIEFEKTNERIHKSINAIDFVVETTQKGVDHFHKENYPSMKLEINNGRFFINGFYNPEEERFITNYFITYGKQILSITPDVLKYSILKTLSGLDSYYRQLNTVVL